jgi:hypothetical protein
MAEIGSQELAAVFLIVYVCQIALFPVFGVSVSTISIKHE